jgi:formylglycine-generating enzyme required for sulfatase activity
MLELSEVKNDVTWRKAMNYAKKLGKGWRLPTKKELAIIANSPKSGAFDVRGLFWSSSASLCNTDFASYTNLYDGNTYTSYKTATLDARCIRGSFEDVIEWCFGKEEKC